MGRPACCHTFPRELGTIQIVRPWVGKITIPCEKGNAFSFDFGIDEAEFVREGDNLALDFGDGTKVVLEGLYALEEADLPGFVIDGEEIAPADFLAALGEPTLLLAAGPSAVRSGRYNDHDSQVGLLEGIDRLDGIDWTLSTSPDMEEGPGDLDTGTRIDHGVSISLPAGAGANGLVLTVHKSGLDNGFNPGEGTSASGSITISAPDGVASITINGVSVLLNGQLTGNTVATDEGYLEITGYDSSTGQLDFAYVLTNSASHPGDGNDSVSRSFEIVVTDRDGDTATASVTVEIVDDVPELGDLSSQKVEDDSATISVVVGGIVSGADLPGTIEVEVTKDGEVLVWTFEVSVDGDGNYTFTLDAARSTGDGDAMSIAANDDGTYEITYARPAGDIGDQTSDDYAFHVTLTDADGDSSEQTIVAQAVGKVSFDPVTDEDGNPVVGSVTVDESALVTGNVADPDGDADKPSSSVDSGSFSFSLNGQPYTLEIEGADTIVGGAGDDNLYGGTGDDLLIGDGSADTVTKIEEALDLEDASPSYIYNAITNADGETLEAIAEIAEGGASDGNDVIRGGAGDDLLFGMGGDDYLVGGEGSDIIFGGAGNDIIVFDANDYYVHGGGNGLPTVEGVEVILSGEGVTALASMSELAEQLGITVTTDDVGVSTMTLSTEVWEKSGDGTYTNGYITLSTSLDGQTDITAQTITFTLSNS